MEYSALPFRPHSPTSVDTMKLFLLLLLASGSALANDAALQQCRTMKDAAQRLACYDAIVPAPAAIVAARPSAEQSFGLVEKKVPLASIESSIPGSFDGWVPNQIITLANDQAWRVIDDSTGVVYGKDLKVKLERTPFGTTFMVIEGSRKAPKVKRIR